MTLSIRRIYEHEVDLIAPLFDAYRQFYSQPADLPRARAFLHQRMQRGESVVLLAERDGTAAGFTQLFPMFSSLHTTRVWVLNDLYVASDARRDGIARALLDAAARFARDDGAARIVLETNRDNTAARALYRAAGWMEDDTQWYGLVLLPRDG
ncbi:MAG: GNAT family N-acetyltransferase [Pseudomonadota bacterium]|nr:GNAT family N-acetyltransferase [Pseudomonadota bacterium]